MRPFRIAVVGCGGIVDWWLPTLLDRPDTEIVALADTDAARAHATASRYHLSCPLAEDVEAAVGAARPNVVVNLTPPEHHAAVVAAALRSGCHVLGEKPMANSLREAEMLARLAERVDRTYAVMQNYRFGPVRRFRDEVAAGRIGTPHLLCADFFQAPHFGDFRDRMANPLLLDMAIHHFDMARFLTGADALSADCREVAAPGSWYRANATAVCTFELQNGVVFTYRGSWVAPGAATAWCASWRVVGTAGTAIWDGIESPWAELAREPASPELIWPVERVRWPAGSEADDGHAACIAEMLDALASGRRPETHAADNVKSLAMTLAAITSAALGKRVLLEDLPLLEAGAR